MTPVAICIVAFRDAAQIVECLDAVGRLTFTDYEVLICENGGAAAHAALVTAVPTQLPGGQAVTCTLAPGNLGYAGGVNLCMRARPDARAWLVLNPDVVVEPETLGALMQRLDRGDCAAAGGTLYHPDGKVQAHGGHWRGWLARAESIGWGSRVDDPVDAAAIESQTHYVPGALMLIGRAFVDGVGLMREDYFLYAEEVEWCLRAGAKGLRFGFAPGARVCHGQGGTTGSAKAVTERPKLPIYLDERNKLNVVRDTTPLRLPVAIVMALVLTWLRFGRRGARRQWRWAIEGWWAGVRGERGVPAWLLREG